MNILYIHSHDTGRYVQPYGHAMPTPNLQRLAEEGILFRQAFSCAPTCSPSRAALLTGQCPHSAGMLGLAHRGFSLRDPREHMAAVLHARGYETILVGVQHEVGGKSTPTDLGYETVQSVAGHRAADIAEAACGLLSLHSGHRQDVGEGDGSSGSSVAGQRPFFMSVGFSDTHRPFPEPGDQDDARYMPRPAPLPDTPEVRRDMAGFQASVRRLDDGIGRVLEALNASGLADETLVICTTDHGIAFPSMKCNLTDHGIGVMLMMRGPGGFTGGRVVDSLISHIDIFPTVCDLAGIERPSWLQGQSLLPLLDGRSEVNDAVFAEVTYHAAYEPQRCVRTQRWKYIRRYGSRSLPVMPNCDDSPGKDVLIGGGWHERPVAKEQLYDLLFDANEASNIANDPTAGAVLVQMRQRLSDWMTSTADPLLKSPHVPAPPGAQVNREDGLSPQEPTVSV